GAHSSDPREPAGPGDRGLQLGLGKQDGHPQMGREGRPPAHRAGPSRRLRRDHRREDPLRHVMKRIVILGGGVGGTLTGNLLIKKLRSQVKAGDVSITVVDQTGQHTYQPGFMYIAMGGERADRLQRPERGLLDKLVTLVVGNVDRIDECTQRVFLTDGLPIIYDYLVLATGSRIAPEEIEHFDTEAYHFYTAEAALELRRGLDAFTGGRIVIGIAGMPYKCPPAPLEVAFLIEAELRQRWLREKSEMH